MATALTATGVNFFVVRANLSKVILDHVLQGIAAEKVDEKIAKRSRSISGAGKSALQQALRSDLEDYLSCRCHTGCQAVASTLAIREESSGQALSEGGSVAPMSSEGEPPLLAKLIVREGDRSGGLFVIMSGKAPMGSDLRFLVFLRLANAFRDHAHGR